MLLMAEPSLQPKELRLIKQIFKKIGKLFPCRIEKWHKHVLAKNLKILREQGLPICIGSRALEGGSPKKTPVTEPEFCPHSRKVVLDERTNEQNKISLKYRILLTTWPRKPKMPREKKCAIPVIVHKKMKCKWIF